LKERLGAITPHYGWLSEETEDNHTRLSANRIWIVDPIDGTRAFLAGTSDWSISVALVERHRPIMAAIFAPSSNEMFFAAAGCGATCNGEPIIATQGHMVDGARVTGPKSFLDHLSAAEPNIVRIAKIQSLALRFARVAQGRIDAAFASANGYDWDLAAADL